MPRDTTAYIAVGSNIRPQHHIARCLDLLAELPDCRQVSESAWYLTRPWGLTAQPHFVNLVVGVCTRVSAESLLRETQAIEQRLHRARSLKHGPRTIDLDILLFGDLVIEGPGLIIPHPALLERDFMLLPLLEIAPDLPHPIEGAALRDLTGRIRYHQIISPVPNHPRPVLL